MTPFDELNAQLAKASFIVDLRLKTDTTNGNCDLILTLSATPSGANAVTAIFKNVAQLKVQLGLGGWSQVHMLGIRQENSGWERPYVVEEIEDRSLSFICENAWLTQD
jgi:hypothetical protein